jgi:hypothetical protein
MPTICYATGCNQKVDPNTAFYKMVAGSEAEGRGATDSAQ